ncbi:hypothetical protein FB451DRAFT_1185825 [Mycena latifolia]|nr:hypothetical protein FB451DRAFT_1185825 [Mycena latifolia]
MREKVYTSVALGIRTSPDSILGEVANGEAPLEVLNGGVVAEGELRVRSSPAANFGAEKSAADASLKVKLCGIAVDGGLNESPTTAVPGAMDRALKDWTSRSSVAREAANINAPLDDEQGGTAVEGGFDALNLTTAISGAPGVLEMSAFCGSGEKSPCYGSLEALWIAIIALRSAVARYWLESRTDGQTLFSGLQRMGSKGKYVVAGKLWPVSNAPPGAERCIRGRGLGVEKTREIECQKWVHGGLVYSYGGTIRAI